MHVRGIGPTLMHAEIHNAYLPRQGVDRIQEVYRLAKEVEHSDDLRVDGLIRHVNEIATRPENFPEPIEWTPPQRIVWRCGKIATEKRMAIVTNRKVAPSIATFVCVNGGRWIIHCPFPGCRGAQYASYQDHLFWCVDCNNRAVGERWIEVGWPDNPQEIERWLFTRPDRNMHWVPGETELDIAQQDVEMVTNG